MEQFANLTQEQRDLCEAYAKEQQKHNGWTNYETWRVHLELFQDYIDSMSQDVEYHGEKLDDVVALADHLQEYAEEYIQNAFPSDFEAPCYAMGWANAFAAGVNYMEIARNAVDANPNLLKSETETEA